MKNLYTNLPLADNLSPAVGESSFLIKKDNFMNKILLPGIVALAFLLTGFENTIAASIGPNFAGTGATGGGAGNPWNNPGRVTANDNSYTTVTPGTGTSSSEALNATNFNFNVPAGATINGIQVYIGRFRSSGTTGEIRDYSLNLIKGGTAGGTNKAATTTNWPASEGIATYGTTNDLWGNTWGAADINAANFGVALRVINSGTGANRTANVDYITVTVTYTCIDYALTAEASATPVCGSGTSTVTLTSTTLPDGTYTVTYSTTNPATSGNTATMVFSGTTGTFTTISLSATSTVTVGTLSSGTAPAICSSTITTNNTATVTVSPLPTAPVATAATNILTSGFTANWGTVSGATGYYLDVSTVNNFASFVSGYNNLDVSNVTSYDVSGLNPATTYYYRVRSYNATCTSISSNTITTSTSEPPTRYSVATGNWNATSTWAYSSGGPAGAPVPTSSNDVFIEGADAVTVNATGATCGTLTIGGATTGTLSISYSTTTGTFTVAGDVNIANNGSFIVTNVSYINAHTVYIGGDLTVNGTFNMTTGTDDNATVIFNGSSQQTISGNGATCTFYSLTASNTSAVGLVLGRNISLAVSNTQTATNLTVTEGDIFDLASFTCNRATTGAGTLAVNGTLRLSGTSGGQTGSNFPLNFNTVTTSGTVEYYSASGQTVYNRTYTNLILSGSGAKTIGTAANGTLTTGNLSIAPTGTATASVTNTNVGVGTLTIGGTGTVNGTWGSTSSVAAHQNNTYFAATTGYLNVSTSSCASSPNAPASGGNQSICSNQTIPALTVTVGSGETADWYSAATGGTLLLSGNTSYTPSGAGTFYAEARNTTSNCISSTRTGVTLTITTAATAYAGPDANGTIGVPFTFSGASASNYASILWTKSGGTGTFTGTNTLTPTYTPVTGDPGTITFTLTANGNSPCGAVNDDMTLTIGSAPATSAWSLTAASSNWFDPANWGGTVPGATTNITIPTGATNYPTLNSPATCASITIENGGSFIGSEYLTVTGTSTAKRDLNDAAFHFLSSPVQSTTFGQVFPNNQMQIWAQAYDPATGWVNQTISNTMVPGVGYSVWTTVAPITATFTGAFNNSGVAVTTASDTWNLLGNPYTSAIGWDQGLPTWRTGLDNSVYVWPGAYAGGNYITYVGGVGGALTGGIIPPQNGFFVYANPGTTEVTIPLTTRLHSNQAFYKKDAVPDLLHLAIAGNNYQDHTYIHFDMGATAGFDRQFDAYKLYGNDEAPQFYSIVPDNILSVNSLPSITSNPQVPLGLEVGAETTYTITADGMESFDPYVPIRLDDLKLGYTQDLRLNNTYTFTAAPGDDVNRFNVRFYSPVGAGEPDFSNFLVYSDKGNLIINNAGNYKGFAHIYNAAGQLISTYSLHTGIQNVAALPIGMYVVKVVTGQSTISRKVVLF